jgi:hypothetical protein
MKHTAITILLLAISSNIFAAKQSGTITGFIPYSTGTKEILIFKLKDNISGGCNTTGRFAIDSTSVRYKATLSAVIASYHAQTPIKVEYKQTCNSWGNSADISFICVGDISC